MARLRRKLVFGFASNASFERERLGEGISGYWGDSVMDVEKWHHATGKISI